MVPSALWMITSALYFRARRFALFMAVSWRLCLEVMRLFPSRLTAQPPSYGTTCWCKDLPWELCLLLLKKSATRSLKMFIQELDLLLSGIFGFFDSNEDTIFIKELMPGLACCTRGPDKTLNITLLTSNEG